MVVFKRLFFPSRRELVPFVSLKVCPLYFSCLSYRCALFCFQVLVIPAGKYWLDDNSIESDESGRCYCGQLCFFEILSSVEFAFSLIGYIRLWCFEKVRIGKLLVDGLLL